MNTQNRHGSVLLKVLIAIGILFLLFLFLSPAFRSARGPARNTMSKGNLRSIGIAIYNYQEIYGSFPPGYTVDDQGNRLHSWRTLLLPFLEEQELYDSIDLTKPWNDPANAKAMKVLPDVYRCPAVDLSGSKTNYLGIAIEGGVFSSAVGIKETEITDIASDTILALEVPYEYTVHWMAPTDAGHSVLEAYTPDANVPHVYSYPHSFNLLMGDASVKSYRVAEQRQELIPALKKMATYAGGEEIGEI